MDENKKSSQVDGATSEDKQVNDSIDYYLKEQNKSLFMAILALVISIFILGITIGSNL